MSKLVVIGPLSLVEKTTTKLHDLQVMHILDHTKSEDVDIGMPMARASSIAGLLVKLRGIAASLKIDLAKAPRKAGDTMTLKQIEGQCSILASDANSTHDVLKHHEKAITEFAQKKQLLHALKILRLDPETFQECLSIRYLIGSVKHDQDLKEAISSITSRFELNCASIDAKTYIALFYEHSKEKELKAILEQHVFQPLDINPILGMKGTAGQLIEQTERQLETLQKKKDAASKKQDMLARKWTPFLAQQESYLVQEAEIAEAPLKFGCTQKAFMIKGWVPTKRVQDVVTAMNNSMKNKLYITTQPLEEGETVPIEFANPKAIKPFEFFMHLYTLPKFDEVDPTFFIFLTFPLLFGFMLGDIGYGLTTLILFYIFMKKMPQFKDFFKILIFASFASIFFGALFGEFFGAEELGGYELPHLLSRAHQLNLLLYIAVAIGVVHVLLGIFIGFYNELKHHGFLHAFCAKLSWVIILAGAGFTGVSYLNYTSLPMLVGFITLGIGVLLLTIGEGTTGVVEIPGIFGNILSYARLMAIGLASVGLATVVNKFAEEFFHQGGFMIVAGVVTLVVGHLINILLGIIGPFLHSLRLHYVEFFTKFYKGGGKPYKPFGIKT
ncbi:V-type ATP synthase subunit I [Candidatus Woesearchaeota archaeon]|nr:V-type ATP synthase subunit I [Candidatus Woesearchaeota archaeon]